MIKIEIFDRKTNEVVETKTFDSARGLESFEFYWGMQCNNDDYGYRQVEA